MVQAASLSFHPPTCRATDLSGADFRPAGPSVSGAGHRLRVKLRLVCGLISGGVGAGRESRCGIRVGTEVGVGAGWHVGVGTGWKDSIGADQVGQQRASGRTCDG